MTKYNVAPWVTMSKCPHKQNIPLMLTHRIDSTLIKSLNLVLNMKFIDFYNKCLIAFETIL